MKEMYFILEQKQNYILIDQKKKVHKCYVIGPENVNNLLNLSYNNNLQPNQISNY